ncbi:MAG: hypothetical protein CFE21_06605 [Bacteroidetes bacterium B1(2017)]|nr:MAG: hypothetical protein CFE21_06605 [Bacteroidetes bacterium B1(2017)]
MQSQAKTIEEYLVETPEDRREALTKLINLCRKHLGEFEEKMTYGMIGFVVPLKVYPKGYHVNPNQALPFINIASQKNFIAFYHMGIYGNEEILNWFVNEYPKHSKSKLDMGKSCIRFKKTSDIPYVLLEELLTKISLKGYIEKYEEILLKLKK